eukprot:Hpha_TRINITY_DN16538_c1_g1::TRINITY_DN16538_c1_g1_i7::g.134611::m.134611
MPLKRTDMHAKVGCGSGASDDPHYLRELLSELEARLSSVQQALGREPPSSVDIASACLWQLLDILSVEYGTTPLSQCVVCGRANSRHEAWACPVIPRCYLQRFPPQVCCRVDLQLQVCTPCRRLYASACDAERGKLNSEYGGSAASGAAPGQGPRVAVRGAAELLRLWEEAPADARALAEIKHQADAERLRTEGKEQYLAYKAVRKELSRRLLLEPGGIGKPGGILTKAMGLSAATRAEMRKAVAEYLGKDPSDVTLADLQATQDDPAADEQESGGHAADVVKLLLSEPDGLPRFIRRWRQVFISSTRPRSIPEGWDPDPRPAPDAPRPHNEMPRPDRDWMHFFAPGSSAPSIGVHKLAITNSEGDTVPVIDASAELSRLSPDDADRTLRRAAAAGVGGVVVLAVTPTDVEAAGRLHGSVKGISVWGTCGLHPLRASEWVSGGEAAMRKVLSRSGTPHITRLVAVGECGLDYSNGEHGPPREVQLECFAAQLSLAKEYDLPVILHERDADVPRGCQADLLRAVDEAGIHPGQCVVHCFTGNAESLEIYAKRGFNVSVAGLVGRLGPRSVPLRAALASGVLPLEQLLVETDAPYLRTDPMYIPNECDLLPRGRSEPALTPAVVRAAAECLGVGAEQVATISTRNAMRVFRITLGDDIPTAGNDSIRLLSSKAEGEELMLSRKPALCEPHLTPRGCRRGAQCQRRHVEGWQEEREWLTAVKCRFGLGCPDSRSPTTPDTPDETCPFSHIGTPIRLVCQHAVAGRCRRGESCWYPHPPESACRVLAPVFAWEPCHYADKCKRPVCIRGHGPEMGLQEMVDELRRRKVKEPYTGEGEAAGETEDKGGGQGAEVGAEEEGQERALREALAKVDVDDEEAAERW